MSALLHIDDHAVFSKIVATYFLKTQYKDWDFVSATCLTSAVSALKSRDFTIILLDHRIPPHFDFRVSLDILQNAGWTGPTILMSGERIPNLGKEAGDARVASFMLKDDFSAEAMESTIQDILSASA